MNRYIFTVIKAWQHFSLLRQVRRDPTQQVNTIVDIDLKKIRMQGIKALVVDFDGVLSAYGEPAPKSAVLQWLNEAIACFGSQYVVILTNKPFLARQQFLDMHLPGLSMPCYPKKPYPTGLIEIADHLQLNFKDLLIIDDRLLTGVLAALIVGAQVRWITKPYISFRKKPLEELGFILLRTIEKILFR